MTKFSEYLAVYWWIVKLRNFYWIIIVSNNIYTKENEATRKLSEPSGKPEVVAKNREYKREDWNKIQSQSYVRYVQQFRFKTTWINIGQ